MTSMHTARTVNYIIYENRGEETQIGHICAQEAHCQDTFVTQLCPQTCNAAIWETKTFFKPQNITPSHTQKRSQKTLLVTIYLK